jgi:hypothetical protein
MLRVKVKNSCKLLETLLINFQPTRLNNWKQINSHYKVNIDRLCKLRAEDEEDIELSMKGANGHWYNKVEYK